MGVPSWCAVSLDRPTHLVLLGALGGEQGEDGHHHEEQHHTQLGVGVEGQSFQHQRVVVANVDIVVRVLVERDAYVAVCGQ